MKSKKELKNLPRIISEPNYKLVDKNWGFEKWIVNTADYCGKEIVCLYGKWSSEGKFHYHKVKDEDFYVIRGHLELEIKISDRDDGIWEFFLKRGDSIRIRPYWAHRFRSQSKPVAIFYEFSTHHDDGDSYYLEG